MEIKSLGDYSLIKELGKGTFGSVYLAEHRFIKKKCALKVFSKEFSNDSNFIERFEKESGFLASLDHPSILKIKDVSYADGYYFLIMDACVDDDIMPASLESFLEKRAGLLKEKEVESILRQVASMLDYIHDINKEGKQLTHGGIKPSNLFLKETDQGLNVYISDIGISDIIGIDKVLLKNFENLLKTFTFGIDSMFFKNFSFLSPEYKEEAISSIPSDIYAFGVLGYYLITKSFPEGYFDLPSKVALEYKLNWDLLICRCLCKDVEKRPIRLVEAMDNLLKKDIDEETFLEVLSWQDIGKTVENAMQMSFEFSKDEMKKGKDIQIIEKVEDIQEDLVINSDDTKLRPIINPGKIDRPLYEPDPGAIFQKELNVSYYTPKKEAVKEVEPILTEMVVIKGGSYNRGSNNGARDEMPEHMVTISSFALDIHPVTNEQFVRFLESMGGEKDINNNDIIRLRDSRINRSGGKLSIESGYMKHPVVGVTWYGASAYSKWVGKRLPTEAEWEIASSAMKNEFIYPSGEKIDHTLANFFSSDTTAVQSYPSSEIGLYDMAGNVYEWCEDWYAYNYYDSSLQEPDNPKGPQQGVYRVLRGGCWKSLKEDLRCAHRHRNNPGAFNSTYGFRCAADVS